MTLNNIVGEKILIYNCCFDNLIAAVTDYIYIYIWQDEKNIFLYSLPISKLTILLFLSTDTNYRQRSWKTEGSLVLSCFVMKIEVRRQRPPWPREVKPDLGTGALTDSNCVIVVLWTAKGGFSVKRHESQKSIGLNFISVLFSKCFCPPQPLQTTP